MIVEEIKYLYHDKDTESHQNQLHDRVHGPVVVFHQKKTNENENKCSGSIPCFDAAHPTNVLDRVESDYPRVTFFFFQKFQTLFFSNHFCGNCIARVALMRWMRFGVFRKKEK